MSRIIFQVFKNGKFDYISIFHVGTPVNSIFFVDGFNKFVGLQNSNSSSGFKESNTKYDSLALVACMEKPFCKYRASEHPATTQPLAKGEIGRVSWDRSSPCARVMRRMTTASTRAQLKRYERGALKGSRNKMETRIPIDFQYSYTTSEDGRRREPFPRVSSHLFVL